MSITNCDGVLLQSATARVITNCDEVVLQIATGQLLQIATGWYYKVRQVLQIATTGITNCDRYYKLRRGGITNCDRYYKVRRYYKLRQYTHPKAGETKDFAKYLLTNQQISEICNDEPLTEFVCQQKNCIAHCARANKDTH